MAAPFTGLKQTGEPTTSASLARSRGVLPFTRPACSLKRSEARQPDQIQWKEAGEES